MMTKRRFLRGLGLAVAALFLFIVLLYALFPVAPLNNAIALKLAEQGLTIAPEASKTILPGVVWSEAALSSAQGPLLAFDRLKVQPQLAPLLLGRMKVAADLALAGGEMNLLYGLNGSQALALQADKIELAKVPFFKTVLGATAGGLLWSEGTVRRTAQGLNGELKLEVKQLQYSGVKMGAFALPDAANLRTQGMVRISGGRARLESFTLQGEGIYMRLSGDLPNGPQITSMPLDLTLEIMPKPEFMERQKLVFLLLAKFMISPGVYRVPIRGTLLKPVIL
ncbi:type II secretion system protein GspN [Pelotalea chapellei]|uniref:Type II secretion system protein GspN n=1 Tax=Pelotalea chapellei TaxID=44671 RepID=A0ABS5U4Y2_9BACT|nr:type II secretion system protein GspN [Pelotalea chapellei]MBT1070728.1 type II secretion system protein GspN [Pelotalea chapellei]